MQLGPARRGTQQQLLDAPAPARRQDRAPLRDVPSAHVGDSGAGSLGLHGEAAAVADEVLAHILEAHLCGRGEARGSAGAAEAVISFLPKGFEEGAAEELGAGGGGDGVWHGGLEAVDLGVYDGEELHGGAGGHVAEELDQGLDGGDGHGEFLVFREEAIVRLDEAGKWPLVLVRHSKPLVICDSLEDGAIFSFDDSVGFCVYGKLGGSPRAQFICCHPEKLTSSKLDSKCYGLRLSSRGEKKRGCLESCPDELMSQVGAKDAHRLLFADGRTC